MVRVQYIFLSMGIKGLLLLWIFKSTETFFRTKQTMIEISKLSIDQKLI